MSVNMHKNFTQKIIITIFLLIFKFFKINYIYVYKKMNFSLFREKKSIFNSFKKYELLWLINIYCD